MGHTECTIRLKLVDAVGPFRAGTDDFDREIGGMTDRAGLKQVKPFGREVKKVRPPDAMHRKAMIGVAHDQAKMVAGDMVAKNAEQLGERIGVLNIGAWAHVYLSVNEFQ